jgi:cell division protein FtsQ
MSRAGTKAGSTSDTAASVRVHPRMRSRRIGVRRDAGRRRLRRVGYALVLAALVAGGAVAIRSPLLDVDRVTVTGLGHTTSDEVREAAAIEQGEPLLSVDTDGAASRIEELPWVDTARVGRSWPSTVTVRVTERVPVAEVQVSDTSVALVDADGRVVGIESRAADAPRELLALTGVEGRLRPGDRLPADARDALTVADAVAERMPGVVASVSTDLDAALVDGGAIRFGSTENLGQKVTAAKTVLNEVDLTCLELIDVRVPGSPALTRNQRCS